METSPGYSRNSDHGFNACANRVGFGRGNYWGSGYTVEINETVTNGFTHPGVGVTKSVLENMRTQVLAKKNHGTPIIRT